MDDHRDESTPRQGRRTMGIAIGVVAVTALLVVGVIAARDSGPVRAELPTSATPVTTTDSATTSTPAVAADAPVGKGTPIEVSGTDPITGKGAKLSSLSGKPVVLTIWASWCPGCNSEAPHLSKVAAARDDVDFFGINYRDNAADAKGFYSKYGWKFPAVEDADGELATGLGLQGTPTTLFLDAQHREVGRVVGPMDEDGLRDAIDQLTGA